MHEIANDTKYRIADLYQNTKMSVGSIASALEVSRRTVQNYKNLDIPTYTQRHTK